MQQRGKLILAVLLPSRAGTDPAVLHQFSVSGICGPDEVCVAHIGLVEQCLQVIGGRFCNQQPCPELTRKRITLNCSEMPSQNVLGLSPAAWAACCTFSPCSSVPVDKMAGSPSASRVIFSHRCAASAKTAEYKWPM